MFTIAVRRAGGTIATVVLALLVAGCGGGTETSTTPTGTPQTNGMEQRPAAEVQQAAVAAFKAAKSVHVAGMGLSEGTPVRVDARLQGNAGAGTLQLEGVKLEITVIGNTTYLKADQQTWTTTVGVPAAVAHRIAGRWVKVGPEQVSNLTGFTLDSYAADLAKSESPLQPKVQQTTLDGNKVVVLTAQDGTKFYVANTGPPYPVRAEKTGADAGRIDFTEYGADFHITAPADAITLGDVS
jgi:hypothetical protein